MAMLNNKRVQESRKAWGQPSEIVKKKTKKDWSAGCASCAAFLLGISQAQL